MVLINKGREEQRRRTWHQQNVRAACCCHRWNLHTAQLEPTRLLLLQSLSHCGGRCWSTPPIYTHCLSCCNYWGSQTVPVTLIGNAKILEHGVSHYSQKQKKKILPLPSAFQPPVSVSSWPSLIRSQLASWTGDAHKTAGLWNTEQQKNPQHLSYLALPLVCIWRSSLKPEVLVLNLYNILPQNVLLRNNHIILFMIQERLSNTVFLFHVTPARLSLGCWAEAGTALPCAEPLSPGLLHVLWASRAWWS